MYDLDSGFPNGSGNGSAGRSSKGCWTCRLRKKKCDEHYPVCTTCAQLLITCHYEKSKPVWMDGGTKQEEMAESLKREVKEKAHHRKIAVDGRTQPADSMTTATNPRCKHPARSMADGLLNITHNNYVRSDDSPDGNEVNLMHFERLADCVLTTKLHREKVAFGQSSETVLLMFYLEHVVPFMFSLYRPTPFEGGKAWLMEMMISSPVVRQAALCQSSFFFSLMTETSNDNLVWETVLTQTAEAFETLRKALQYIDNTNIAEHMHGTVRVLASVLQVQRFEIAVLSFDNCRAHLSAAVALFEALMRSSGSDQDDSKQKFASVIGRLGPTSQLLPGHLVEVQSAEQAAFRFSSALLIFDDIIASTTAQEPPQLYGTHQGLLCARNGPPLVDIESVIGCHNTVLLQIGEISNLDAWKQQRRRCGDLDMMELVRRATFSKELLGSYLHSLASRPVTTAGRRDILLDQTCALAWSNQRLLVSRIWCHAALLYLSVVVSGWQPANFEVQYHVENLLDLLDGKTYQPALLRSVVWPFCVAGSLAMPSQEARFRAHMEALEQPRVFGALHKALEIMERAWRNRDAVNGADRDLATFFREEDHLVLLV